MATLNRSKTNKKVDDDKIFHLFNIFFYHKEIYHFMRKNYLKFQVC